MVLVAGILNSGIGQGRFWDCTVLQEEVDRFEGSFGASFLNINSVAYVVLRGTIGRGFKN